MNEVENVVETADIAALIDLASWTERLPVLTPQYRSARPFPHIFLEDVLRPDKALQAAREFPAPESTSWTHYKHVNENKLGKNDRDHFPPLLGQIVDTFNSPAFVQWLSQLTGIEGLMSDPLLEGGGLHQTEPGGFLNVHADFTMHHYHKRWRRRINMILYMNERWEDDWGGAIELWDGDMLACVEKVPPYLNHALVFNTNENSYHGYPDPIQCPNGVQRRSIALYYYTAEADSSYSMKSTNYKSRPDDNAVTRIKIWLDKVALDIYSRLKARFGWSDELASNILRKLSRNKKKYDE